MSNGELHIGVYVDAENIRYNGGYSMRYDILRRFAGREGEARLLRLNTYMAVDDERMKRDGEYRERIRGYQQAVRDLGWKIIEKPVRWFVDEEGNSMSKANADLDLAVDVMLQSERLDQVLLVTGDGDFLQVVRALQNKGCRVEVLAFRNVSRELQHEADAFYSGYLVPGLIPSRGDARVPWGELGSRIRGICIRWEADRGFGFIRFLTAISARLWVTDTRQEDSPYESAFVHISDLPRELDTDDLPSRDIILEFDLESSETEKGGFIARRCTVVNRYDGRTGGLAKLPDRAVAMEREEEEGPSSKGEAKEIAAVADPS
ncbi:LabA-like NYN domain-containing protein [Acidithiobacillus ferriphilus]|uniref:LabA-like NYN domain-containing protein n=1 Tax=Acidithiobacillus ferriphilus TaxID=1689834 RepID=UPI001C0796A5|nr:NYN domain-containing protein [Acidithiobacillus ferriphilus]MBU2848749.1 NYN domain-containing protein [Acidithiobacillus ferriphilus]MEB8536297.1 NYN domain-containing protein [Acidithiobacillus ferriphilus]